MRLPATLILSAILLYGIAPVVIAQDVSPGLPALPPSVEKTEQAAVQWLLAQMVPNEVVPAPSPGRRRLLLSYAVPQADPVYRYIYGRSFVYDDALAAVALTMTGRYREAEFVLNALERLLAPDGSLWFAYNTQNSWPDPNDHGGAIVRSGAVAWVGYALTYYLSVREQGTPGFAARDPLGIEYLRAARSIASYLRGNQVADRSDPRYGLVTGGLGATTLELDPASSKPAEEYSAAKVEWVSVEHNIDAWFFLRDLARLTSDADLAATAGLLRDKIDQLWSAKDGQFFQGIRDTRAVDTVLPLDGASWGSLFLAAQGQAARASQAAEAMRRYSCSIGEARGFRPYADEPVYLDPGVNRFYFPGRATARWSDLPFIWGEGSFGAAAAFARTGRRDEALAVLDSLQSLAVGGGFRYASTALAYQFTDYPSVASTTWFIITAEILRGGPAAAAFWGP